MASPFGEASPFRTHGGAGNEFKRFGNEQTNLFQQATSGSSAFGTGQTTAGSSIFGGSISTTQPNNGRQFDLWQIDINNPSSTFGTSQTMAGSSIFGGSISTTHTVGTSSGQRGLSTSHESTPSPFAPASHVMPPSRSFGKASSFTNSFGFSTQTNSFGSMALGASPCTQHTGNTSILGGVAANPFKPTQATPLVGSSGFRTCHGKSSVSFESAFCGDWRPKFGENLMSASSFLRTTASGLSSSGYGAFSSVNAVVSMEDDKLMSISAIPPYENSSPEELRWKEYRSTTRAASELTFQQVATSSCFGQPNLVNYAGASYPFQSSTPSSIIASTSSCHFCGSIVSKAMPATMPSPGFNTGSPGWVEGTPVSSGCIEGTPSSASVLGSSSNSFNSTLKVTPASTSFGPPLKFGSFSGIRNQSETAPSMLGSSSSLFDSPIVGFKVTPESTSLAPPLGFGSSSGINNQLEIVPSLGWTHNSSQSSGQLSFLLPASNSITPSIMISSKVPSTTGMDQNTSIQWPLTAATITDFSVPPSLVSVVPNVGSSSSVHCGIASLPVFDKCSQARTTSWLTSRHIFQRSVIRMHARRHRSAAKKDGPKVSFLNDNMETPNFKKLVPRENPRALLFHDLPVANDSKQNGPQKRCSISEQSGIQGSLTSLKLAEVKLSDIPYDNVNQAEASDPKHLEKKAVVIIQEARQDTDVAKPENGVNKGIPQASRFTIRTVT